MPKNENVVLTNMCMIYDDKGNIVVQTELTLNGLELHFPAGMLNLENPLLSQLSARFMKKQG